MKIIYSCGNRIGAGVQLVRFLRHIGDGHDIRIAGYKGPTESISHIDWTLDALSHRYSLKNKLELIKLFSYYGIPDVGFNEISILIDDINDFNPDLVICDMEPIMANIANVLGLRLWYCSPIHLLDGIKWENGQLRYKSQLEKYRKLIYKLPKAEKIFIYSPFGNIENGPKLKSGYEWIRPYHIEGVNSKLGGVAIIRDDDRLSILSKILNCVAPFDLTMFSRHEYNLSHMKSVSMTDEKNRDIYNDRVSRASWIFTNGETSFVADGLYNGAKLCIAPNLNDPETLLNAIMIRNYKLGDDVSQIELMEGEAISIIEASYSSWNNVEYSLNNAIQEQLHTKLENLCI